MIIFTIMIGIGLIGVFLSSNIANEENKASNNQVEKERLVPVEKNR